MTDEIRANGDREVALGLLRGGKHVTVRVRPDIQWVRFAGAKWGFPGAIVEAGDGDISRDTSSGKAGVHVGDEIESVGGVEDITTGEQMIDALRTGSRDGKLPVVTVTRPGLGNPIELKPTAADLADVESGHYAAFGLLGFMPAPTLVPAGFGESVSRGLREFGQRVVYLVHVLTSKKIAQDIGGPVMIVRATASSVALGPYYVLEMAGMLSLSLAVINLITIPVLDGGHLFIFLIEAIRRKRLTAQQMQAVMAAGLAAVVVLTFLVIYLDVFRISRGLVPQ
jgi:regulator of sigma E protease